MKKILKTPALAISFYFSATVAEISHAIDSFLMVDHSLPFLWSQLLNP